MINIGCTFCGTKWTTNFLTLSGMYILGCILPCGRISWCYYRMVLAHYQFLNVFYRTPSIDYRLIGKLWLCLHQHKQSFGRSFFYWIFEILNIVFDSSHDVRCDCIEKYDFLMVLFNYATGRCIAFWKGDKVCDKVKIEKKKKQKQNQKNKSKCQRQQPKCQFWGILKLAKY